MRFHDFAGNESAKRQLASYVDSERDRLPHALILEGPRGSGRRTLARLLARAAVCRADKPSDRPCGECAACVKAAGGNHPDLAEAGGDGTARSFHIDTIRALREDAYILPNEAPRRVLILADAQAMTDQAQNALLKLMEEPPRHLMLILTCESRTQLLDTIQSRAAVVALEPVAEAGALTAVLARCPEATEEQAREALAVFGGVIGQAVQGLGEDGEMARVLELTPKIAMAIAAPMEIDLMRLTGRLEKDKETADGVLRALALIIRDALAMRANPSAPTLSISPDAARALGRGLKAPQLMALMAEVEALQRARLRNVNYGLFLTLLCSRLRAAAGK